MRRRRPSPWQRARRAEATFASQLLKIARHVADLSRVLAHDAPALVAALGQYEKLITPWAEAAADRMLAEVERRDHRAWEEQSGEMSALLRRELDRAPVASQLLELRQQQVREITSLPRLAAERVVHLAAEARLSGTRAADLAAEIAAGGDVSRAHARMLARTAVGAAATQTTMVRALHVGSPGYVWRTSRDQAVRASHRKMEGVFVPWNRPPELDGYVAHAGGFANCFPGSVLVNLANGCYRLWRVPYDGELVYLLAGGVELPVTPNHPILTGRGWFPAGAIQVGDYLVQSARQRCSVTENDEDNVLPSFEQLFQALTSVENAQVAEHFDFYGDVPDGQVDVVAAHGLLPGDHVAPALQRLGQFTLSGAYGGVGRARIVGGQDQISEARGAAGAAQVTALLRGGTRHAGAISGADIAALYAASEQQLLDDTATSAYVQGQGLLGLTGQVASDYLALRQVCASVLTGRSSPRNRDATSAEVIAERVRAQADDPARLYERRAGLYQPLRVIQVCRAYYSGHVYTMETGSGHYSVTPAALIAKNCRCYAEPVLPVRS